MLRSALLAILGRPITFLVSSTRAVTVPFPVPIPISLPFAILLPARPPIQSVHDVRMNSNIPRKFPHPQLVRTEEVSLLEEWMRNYKVRAERREMRRAPSRDCGMATWEVRSYGATLT